MKKEKESTRRSFLKNAAAGAFAVIVSPAVLNAETIVPPVIPSGAQAGSASAVSISTMKTEYMVNPLGIDVVKPRFSWVPGSTDRGQTQTAYRVIVASGERNISRNRGDIWDSGKIRSSMSVGIVYNGPSLQSKKRYWWKIMAWNKADRASDWSDPAWFEMGILNASEWTGQWIGGDGTGDVAPYLRKEFNVDAGKTVSRARLYISACAYYVAYINGNRVGDNVLDPGFTVYNKTNLYVTHDVTPMIISGTNCIGAEVGNGFYQSSMPEWNINNAPWKGEPRMMAMLEVTYRDGSSSILTSDKTWKAIGGPCYFNDIYIGDSYDARNEKPGWNKAGYNDADWPNAREAGSPGGVLRAQMLPPMKIVATISPVAVTSPAPGIFVFDFGVNVTGWEVLSASAPAGTKIKIKSGEKLKDGRVRAAYKIEQQEDYYTFKGTGIETWEPGFCYHGYQYVEVSGFPGILTLANMKGRIIHSTVDSVGSFTCSNDLFNKIHENVRHTILNNLHSIPTDTPIYEKNGWTGDAHLILETSMYNFDMNRFYTKWEYDGKDCQRPTGEFPSIWPSADWGFYNSVEWTGVFITLPYSLWQFYGDTMLMGDLYPDLRKTVIWDMDHDSGGFGDWLPPDGNKEGKDPALTARACMCRELQMMKEIADELGIKADSEEWNKALKSKIDSFNSLHWDETNGYFQDKPVFRQTNQVAPLGYGAVIDSERKSSMLKALVKDIEVTRNGHIWAGCIGTRFFWPVLTENGYGDIAYIAANKTDFPSYGEQINAGATTNWETWGITAPRSRNHYFFGTIDQWFYEYLAGIRPTAPGFKSISIKPYIPGDLTSAAGQVTTVHGDVISRWNIEDDGTFTFRVTIPTNTSAEISIPKRNYNSNWVVNETKVCCWKKNAYVSGVQGITSGKDDGNFVMFQAGSGDYHFRVGRSDLVNASDTQ